MNTRVLEPESILAVVLLLALLGLLALGCGQAGNETAMGTASSDDCGGCDSHAPATTETEVAHASCGDDECGEVVVPAEHEHGDDCGSHTVDETGAVYCNEHDLYETECGICQPGLACELEPGEGLKIRLPSESSESKARIASERPHRGPSRESVVAVGQLEFDQNRLAHITPLADGVIQRVFAEPGQRVRRGEPLVELHSSAVAEAKAALLTAAADETVASESYARETELYGADMSSDSALRDAEARHTAAAARRRAAERTLLDLGLNGPALERIISRHEVSSVLTLVAPFDGTVIERDAVVGDLSAVGDRVFTVADLGTMWVSLAVSEKDVALLRVGQPVAVRSASLGNGMEGEISWISSLLNETTRMAEVRAEVPNPDGVLRAGMFVDASIAVGQSAESLLVPRDTVYRFEGDTFVFVRLESDLYELRRVRTGPDSGDMTAITAGLSGEEFVAVDQSYLLKSEFQKSRFGVGCAH